MKKFLLTSVLAILAPVFAQAQVLTMGLGGNVTSLDPHYHSAGPNSAFAYTIFSRLTETDEFPRPARAGRKLDNDRPADLGIPAAEGSQVP